MRRGHLIAILCAASAAPLGVALMAAPDYLHIPKEYLGLCFWGGLLLTVLVLGVAFVIAIRDEAAAPPVGHRRRMISLAGMMFCGTGFIVFAGIYFWPRTNIATHTIVSEPPPAPTPLPLAQVPSSAIGNPVLIEPPPSARTNPDGSQRIFIRVLPHEMSANFEGRTTNQATALVAPYLHKWISISAIVNNAKTYADGTTLIHFVSVTNQTTVTVTGAEFDEKWREHLDAINKGDAIKVVCRISKIEHSIVSMDNCELFE